MVSSEEADEDPMSQLYSRMTDFSYCYRINRPTGTKKDRAGQPCEFYRYTISGKVYSGIIGAKEEPKETMIKRLARTDYERKYRQPEDTAECFGIKPRY